MKKKDLPENGLRLRDYSHLPRAKDYPRPKKLSAKTRAFVEATAAAMEALQREEQKRS